MMLMNTDVGASITVRGTLKDENGVVVTGASVSAFVLKPKSPVTDLGLAADEGGGVYSVNIDIDTPGYWVVRLVAAAPTKAAAEGTIFVRDSQFS